MASQIPVNPRRYCWPTVTAFSLSWMFLQENVRDVHRRLYILCGSLRCEDNSHNFLQWLRKIIARQCYQKGTDLCSQDHDSTWRALNNNTEGAVSCIAICILWPMLLQICSLQRQHWDSFTLYKTRTCNIIVGRVKVQRSLAAWVVRVSALQMTVGRIQYSA